MPWQTMKSGIGLRLARPSSCYLGGLRARVDHLNRRFTEPPTAEEKQVLNQRRAKAEATPLQRGTLLDFCHLHEFRQSRPSEQPHSDILSPVPQRPLDPKLFHALDPSSSTENIRLRLDFHIVTEGDNWSQVWTAEVERDGQRVGKVVAKLLVEALFPHAPLQLGGRAAHPNDRTVSDVLVRAEAQALPWGETAPVLLLEDLSELSKTLEEVCDWREDEVETTVDDIDGLVCRIFEGQRRLQDLGIVEHASDITNILVLRSTQDIAEAHLVFLDFA
ncbi:hypothetical protein JCM11641_004386 [Rhodosporidiobolus odoratus]